MANRCVLRGMMAVVAALLLLCGAPAPKAVRAAGPMPAPAAGYKVLNPIVRGNLALFPVVAAKTFDTSQLLTLDEGIRSGQVTISENGARPAMLHPGQRGTVRNAGAQVNRLVLYNDSSRPLLLLAGEIVTGGQQDRVIGSDRIVPAKTGPIDLSVFCVEPGRWTGETPEFGSLKGQMAQPEVRAPAMVDKDQQAVWDNVGRANAKAAAQLSTTESVTVSGMTSYAKVFDSAPVKQVINNYGGLDTEQSALKELRAAGASGVIIAVNGRVLWADLFASPDLLAKYWPKLFNSYVAEAVTAGRGSGSPSLERAQEWIAHLDGTHEVAETEPGVYRRTDVTGEGYRVFELTSLTQGTNFTVHITKIAK